MKLTGDDTIIRKQAHTRMFQNWGVKERDTTHGCAGKFEVTQFLQTALFSQKDYLAILQE
jgi:hypothetical protein